MRFKNQTINKTNEYKEAWKSIPSNILKALINIIKQSAVNGIANCEVDIFFSINKKVKLDIFKSSSIISKTTINNVIIINFKLAVKPFLSS